MQLSDAIGVVIDAVLGPARDDFTFLAEPGRYLAADCMTLLTSVVGTSVWQPAVLAKLGATADHLFNGRFAVNVVSGWFKDEFTHLGEPWLEHDERYRRSDEFLQVLRKIWTEETSISAATSTESTTSR